MWTESQPARAEAFGMTKGVSQNEILTIDDVLIGFIMNVLYVYVSQRYMRILRSEHWAVSALAIEMGGPRGAVQAWHFMHKLNR